MCVRVCVCACACGVCVRVRVCVCVVRTVMGITNKQQYVGAAHHLWDD